MVKLPLLLKHDCQYSNKLIRKVFGLYHTKQHKTLAIENFGRLQPISILVDKTLADWLQTAKSAKVFYSQSFCAIR